MLYLIVFLVGFGGGSYLATKYRSKVDTVVADAEKI